MNATTLAEKVRGGLDSLAWILNNADKHDSVAWPEFEKAARDDREEALEALEALEARVVDVERERDAVEERTEGVWRLAADLLLALQPWQMPSAGVRSAATRLTVALAALPLRRYGPVRRRMNSREEQAVPLGWHAISGEDLLAMLRRCANDEDPDLVYAEEYANAEHERIEGSE